MIKKIKRYKHRKKKELDKKQEKEIRRLALKKTVKEKVPFKKKTIEIKRSLFFDEAKELYFNKLEEKQS